ncbi:NAD(P)-dependent oxidoreductase [Komagataeibacter rhaeticus]|uniref:NAD(P)-dependent oxidoreductase n=1 Tax=Komagataeibacter rhaeticus TaxID=215221 RepID=UPI0024914BD7|nr:NAD(P)-dependent oxidoreductase [Komagataeibacter rhaeticus]
MTTCFITQPIHPQAVQFLHEQGFETRFASRPTMEAVIAEVGDAEAVITRDLGFSAEAVAAAHGLRIIACHGSGTNRIAVAAAARRGIPVTRAVNANSRSVAEMTIALMLAAARKVCAANTAVRQGNWNFRYERPGIELHGKTLALVGFGAIARHVAQIAGAGLGMKILAWSPSVPEDIFATHGVERIGDIGDLLRQADVLSLHRPADASGQSLLDRHHLSLLGPDTIIVNTSRGSAIDTEALRDLLLAGDLRAAALDVLPQEPPAPDESALSAPSLILTPHVGATTEEALMRMAMTCAYQIIDCLAGRTPAHVISPPV